MTLGELIAELEKHDQGRLVSLGFARPHSYRGYYDRVAFGPAHHVTIGSMLSCARWALGQTFVGWKGGEYTMNGDTLVHIARAGECNDPTDALNIHWLRSMLDPRDAGEGTRADYLEGVIQGAVLILDGEIQRAGGPSRSELVVLRENLAKVLGEGKP